MKSKIHQPVPDLPVKDVKMLRLYNVNEPGFSVALIYPDKRIGAVSKGETVIFLRKQSGTIINTRWIFPHDIQEIYKEIKVTRTKIVEHMEDKPRGIRQFTT
ncbi:MAG TPA: hypothetical protein VKA49_23215 [Flavitalea sp.]|nr:hypothetical protein [Flavitalea sp.]